MSTEPTEDVKEVKDSTEELHYNVEKLPDTDYPPMSEKPFMIAVRLIVVRAPKIGEEPSLQAEFELHTKEGPKGTIVLPFTEAMGGIGATFFMDLRLHKMAYEDYVLYRPEKIIYAPKDTKGLGVV